MAPARRSGEGNRAERNCGEGNCGEGNCRVLTGPTILIRFVSWELNAIVEEPGQSASSRQKTQPSESLAARRTRFSRWGDCRCFAVGVSSGGAVFFHRAAKHPVSRISKDAKCLILAAHVLNVSRSHETPGVFPKKLTTSPGQGVTLFHTGKGGGHSVGSPGDSTPSGTGASTARSASATPSEIAHFERQRCPGIAEGLPRFCGGVSVAELRLCRAKSSALNGRRNSRRLSRHENLRSLQVRHNR